MAAGKPKLSVELSILTRDLHVERFGCGQTDPFSILRNARTRKLTEEDKPNFLVIKFSYLVRDPETNAIAAFSRVKGKHNSIVADHSVLLSSGIDSELGALNVGGTIAENASYPIMKKLGALTGSLELTARKYTELTHPTRSSAWAARAVNGKNYLFFIHIANLIPGAVFPKDSFPLNYPSKRLAKNARYDEFKGFLPFDDAKDLLDPALLPVDRFALMLAGGDEFELPDDMQAGILTPEDTAGGITERLWKSVQLKPSFFGMGIDLKELFKRNRKDKG